jgi:hypothetical protein
MVLFSTLLKNVNVMWRIYIKYKICFLFNFSACIVQRKMDLKLTAQKMILELRYFWFCTGLGRTINKLKFFVVLRKIYALCKLGEIATRHEIMPYLN